MLCGWESHLNVLNATITNMIHFLKKNTIALQRFFNSTEAEAERANPKVPSSIKFIGPSMNLSHDPWGYGTKVHQPKSQ